MTLLCCKWSRITTGPARPSMTTKFAIDGPAGPVVGGPLVASQFPCSHAFRFYHNFNAPNLYNTLSYYSLT